ncbi:ribonuclease [Herbaspirillum sp. RTI4]|uniref:ribonuclease n=1 Tax=Herbaspirillum sp. RTI4 TaxID=3048640 RepID=UPI002AB48424|nr:ribonuclease [Herbaspirillum sp. RTI4]MDY7577907.1 ribonuclease [Herbaspirillum sp. RTI4]MEA9981647.1 ribonuclease [Herbaspirillum sp. RTI4]
MNKKLLKNSCLWIAGLLISFSVFAKGGFAGDVVALSALPPEARQTLVLINNGGPFPYAKDGAVFGNYERVLPQRGRGYYREFTVPTPRAKNRGARRIISGGEPAARREYFYTDDHYSSFRRIEE